MSLDIAEVKKNTGKRDWGRVEDGNFPTRIVSIIDLGLQSQTDYQSGEPVKSQEKVMITWEFPTERIDIENDEGTQSLPRWQGKEYTLSFHEMAALSKMVGSVAPQITNLSELINMPCAVQIGTTSGGNAKVVGVSKPMKGFETPELENETTFFDFSNPDEELFKTVKPWIQRKIMDAENYDGFADEWVEKEEETTKGDF